MPVSRPFLIAAFAILAADAAPLPALKKAWLKDLDGDGRVERVDDSVPPILREAIFRPGDSIRIPSISILISEPVNLSLNSPDQIFVFKQAGGGAAIPSITSIEKTGDRQYVIRLDPASPWLPGPEDSVSLAPGGPVTDMGGIKPGKARYYPLDGSEPLEYRNPTLPIRIAKPASRAPAKQSSALWTRIGWRINGVRILPLH